MPADTERHPRRALDEREVEWVPVPSVVDANGDKRVTLYDERGRPRARRVAELVLEAFVGPCPPGHELRFKDGDRRNCELANLEWADAVPSGTPPVSGPAAVRPVRVDDRGRLFDQDGEPVVIPGLEPDKVLEGLADVEAGRVRSLREILAERRRG